MSLDERIRRIVDGWAGWSRAERERLGDVYEEIMAHVRDGTGNEFVRQWCNRVLVPRIPGMIVR